MALDSPSVVRQFRGRAAGRLARFAGRLFFVAGKQSGHRGRLIGAILSVFSGGHGLRDGYGASPNILFAAPESGP